MSKRVLVVEDEADVRLTLTAILHDAGYSVETARNGDEALRALRRAPRADLVLLDVHMPVLNGWEFRVRQREDPRIAAVPVIAVSADNSPEAVAIDADAYIRKPAEPAALLDTVERILRLDEVRRSELAQLAYANRMSALATLTTGLSGELSDPLAVIQTNLTVVRGELSELRDAYERGLTPSEALATLKDVDEALAESCQSVDRLATVLHAVRSLVLGPDYEVDLLDIVRSAVEIARSRLPDGGELRCHLAPVPLVRAQTGALVETAVRLLGYAAAATQLVAKPNRRIEVSTRPDANGAALLVSDTGPGMTDEERQRAFEPFYSAHSGDPTGLDLWMCERVISHFRGRIQVDSAPGQGSRFRLWLPAAHQ